MRVAGVFIIILFSFLDLVVHIFAENYLTHTNTREFSLFTFKLCVVLTTTHSHKGYMFVFVKGCANVITTASEYKCDVS